jgi:predicted Zn-dependent protease
MPLYRRPRSRRGNKLRLISALVVAAIALVSYFGSESYNPVTGEDQHVSLTPHQEIALGLQAAPELIREFGGEHPDPELQAYVDDVGFRLVDNSLVRDTEWRFEFYLLDDPETVNAFALPGGPVFITTALYNQLKSEGQLAGVLGHEIGHVVARHGAQQMAKAQLTQGLASAVFVASEEASAAQVAAVVGQLVNMKYGREDELQSDHLGVRFMAKAGYDPRALLGVMEILEAARVGQSPPEFFSTHPDPGNRLQEIEAAIQEIYPNGVPDGLIP